MAKSYHGYMLIAFDWIRPSDDKMTFCEFLNGQFDGDSQCEYVFDVTTGKIALEFVGDPVNFRYVTNVRPLNWIAIEEMSMAGHDAFKEDLDKIVDVLVKRANPKGLLDPVPDGGECVFVWRYSCGVTDSTEDGPGEGWSETKFIGELDDIKMEM